MLKAEVKTRNTGVVVSIAVVVVACLAVGCHKKAAPAGTATETSSVTNTAEGELASGPVAPPEPPQAPLREVLSRADDKAHQAVVGEVDAFLTQQLRTFIQQKNRMPASFSEFARARLDTVPRPPAGKKWVIDTESLEVKAVTQ